MKNIQDLKSVRFAQQGGKCAYCDQPTWLNDLPGFARKYQRPERSLRWLQATAEHLQPRSEGGADTLKNIVAARLYCNTPLRPVARAVPREGAKAAGCTEMAQAVVGWSAGKEAAAGSGRPLALNRL